MKKFLLSATCTALLAGGIAASAMAAMPPFTGATVTEDSSVAGSSYYGLKTQKDTDQLFAGIYIYPSEGGFRITDKSLVLLDKDGHKIAEPIAGRRGDPKVANSYPWPFTGEYVAKQGTAEWFQFEFPHVDNAAEAQLQAPDGKVLATWNAYEN